MTTGNADDSSALGQAPRGPHPVVHGHPAPDLAADEMPVARLFGALERHDAPPEVRTALAAHAASAPRSARTAPAGRLLQRVPFGAWGVASAALLLLSLGTAAFVELSTPAPVVVPELAAGRLRGMTIVEDSSMALFHDVETFDDVGRAPGRLLADWGR